MRRHNTELLLKVEVPEDSGTFVTLGMMRTKDYTITTNTVEASNDDSPVGKTESDPGRRTFQASGTAWLENGAAWARVRDAVNAAGNDHSTVKMQIVDPGEGTYAGDFIITTFGRSATDSEGKIEQNLSVQNAGAWTFTPEA